MVRGSTNRTLWCWSIVEIILSTAIIIFSNFQLLLTRLLTLTSCLYAAILVIRADRENRISLMKRLQRRLEHFGSLSIVDKEGKLLFRWNNRYMGVVGQMNQIKCCLFCWIGEDVFGNKNTQGHYRGWWRNREKLSIDGGNWTKCRRCVLVVTMQSMLNPF